ncbi:ISAs1 family transposase, partial [Escherichia coli]|uniref:ISAs1 family transposase n=1 Tax=Escherichia coli TaxID=562 RepID=UPI0023504365
FVVGGPVGDSELLLCHGTVCVVGKMRDLILQLSKSSIYSTKPFEWKGLKKLCVAVSFRSIIAEQKKEPEMTVRYYISSADLTAEKFATAIRNHWHVENKLHRRLDVVMNEDDYKIRRGNAAELFSGIRHIAINILTNEKVFKAGLRRKMRKAAMDRNYLASVLAGSGLS